MENITSGWKSKEIVDKHQHQIQREKNDLSGLLEQKTANSCK